MVILNMDWVSSDLTSTNQDWRLDAVARGLGIVVGMSYLGEVVVGLGVVGHPSPWWGRG